MNDGASLPGICWQQPGQRLQLHYSWDPAGDTAADPAGDTEADPADISSWARLTLLTHQAPHYDH